MVKEFDIVLAISDKKLIPLEQEIELCRAHVAIMSFRREKNYLLHVGDLPPGEYIPPAILHTLIENGITHNDLEQQDIHFRIDFTRNGWRRIYRVFTETATPTLPSKISEGTGLRYIRARLEESYPGRWRLQSQPVAKGWEVVMEWMGD